MKITMLAEYSDRRKRSGSALVSVMLVSGILLLLSTGILVMSANASFRMRRLTTSAKALSIAESGVVDMIGKMTVDYRNWQDNTNHAYFADGEFSVITRTQPNGNVLIVSTGTVGSISRMAAAELLGTEMDRNNNLFSLNGAITSGGDVRFRTAAFTIRGNVHSNGDITSANGAHNGDLLPAAGLSNCYVTAVGEIGDLQGTHQPNVVPRELPQFDFDSYRQLALDGGIYLEGDQTLRNWNGRPANGIVYVNGNVRIRNNSSLVGTLVANGDITLENNYEQTSYANGMPALLSTGSVTMGNRGRIEGLVYATVNAYIDNNVDIDGGIVSGGFTEINNNTDITHPSEYPPWDAMQPDVEPVVIVGGWLR